MTMDMQRPSMASAVRPWPRLNDAERGALREVLVHGPLPRAEIARRLGVSRASLTRVTRSLLDHGLMAEGAVELRGWTGRPSELVEIVPGARHFFGVKLTGDAIYGVITDLGAHVIEAVEERLDAREVDHVVARICAIFERFNERFGDIAAGGVCLGGDFTQDGKIVVAAHYLGWQDVPLARILSNSLGIPVAVENDVRALTAAEHWFGAGAGCSSLALITIGAGIGFGFMVDDKLITGYHGRAGRLDHLKIDAGGPVCAEGHRGCAAVYLTSASIVGAIHDSPADYPAAVELARSGHSGAVRAFEDAGRALGVVIATVANALDPQKIILTGDGLAVWELANEKIHEAIDDVLEAGPVPINLDVQPFEFTEWARAAAILGIRGELHF